MTLVADPTNTSNGEADGVIVSSNSTSTAAHFWPFVVVTTADAKDAGITMMKRHGAHSKRGPARKVWHQKGRRRLPGAGR